MPVSTCPSFAYINSSCQAGVHQQSGVAGFSQRRESGLTDSQVQLYNHRRIINYAPAAVCLGVA
jgi:hypothetical protein